jgi:NAD(P)-dependent dehydrogenase (short-subunit alcohol dehydrogenase family)
MKILVFGATGALGTEIKTELESKGHQVTSASNSSSSSDIQTANGFEGIATLGIKFDGCVWAQGINANDTLLTSEKFGSTLEANLLFVVNSMKYLLGSNLLNPTSSLVLVSSVWQDLSRKNKFSYSVSKASLEGLVNSVLADFSENGLRINAVLPGVIDSPMTRANLSDQQIETIENQTPSGKLVSANQLARVIAWLLSEESLGINGQFINVDNGWSNVRSI